MKIILNVERIIMLVTMRLLGPFCVPRFNDLYPLMPWFKFIFSKKLVLRYGPRAVEGLITKFVHLYGGTICGVLKVLTMYSS